MAVDRLSPGVSVSVTDESFYIPVQASTVPLFFIATEAGKYQTNGVDLAIGTLESNVVRTVTSRTNSRELFGAPVFRKDISGNLYHGDARNEYGLMGLESFLSVGNRAYVVRADVNLNDSPVSFIALGTPVAGTQTSYGIGNGTIGSITVLSNQLKPQLITVTFTTSTSYKVTGALDGQLGAGNVGSPVSSTFLSFTISAGSTLFSAGDRITFPVMYAAVPTTNSVSGLANVGNGSVVGLTPDTLASAQSMPVVIEFDTPTHYIVSYAIGSGSGNVGDPYDDQKLNFTVVAGSTPFAIGDRFEIAVQQVSIPNPLGSNDAQRRGTIVDALQAVINSNEDIRSEQYEFNIVVCPGYWETAYDLDALVGAVMGEAISIHDTPCNLTPEQVVSWSFTAARLSKNTAAYYYPWGVMSTLDGDDVVVPASAIALTTIAFSDTQSYVWMAPAGLARGQTFGVSSVGYVTGDLGTPTSFVPVAFNEGTRDNLYDKAKTNPITFFPGRGILVFGQKTTSPAASALDRINVARLVMYIRRALRKGALPFVFEPNDQITRDNLKAMADAMLSDVMAKRGLMDFATFCDESNNTAARIDKNELWLDVAIKPTKAAEFIHIPIRVVNSGADIG